MNRYLYGVLLSLILAFPIHAEDDGTSMMPILNKAQQIAEYLEEECQKEIVRIEFDILWDTKVSYRTLNKGWTYNIVAFGDFRFSDIDVSIFKYNGNEWVLEETDADSKDVAIVSITPNNDSEYRIEIKAYKYHDGYKAGHYGLIVCHEKPKN